MMLFKAKNYLPSIRVREYIGRNMEVGYVNSYLRFHWQ